ncbi:putative voltage-gated chloride channel [Scheffersomyces coipomensis]|uniref:putative voltage-gated chloride channel n=1 Tax=Scheffersomyces coipomensis TaxID=1788519 RepID=UPI00315DF228
MFGTTNHIPPLTLESHSRHHIRNHAISNSNLLLLPSTSSSNQHGSTIKAFPSLSVLENYSHNSENHHQKSIPKIKSLGKIDIRSPILPRNSSSFLTPGNNSVFALDQVISNINEQTSLYTDASNQSISTKLLSIGPNALILLRNYYNDFTTIDWAKAFISTNKFNYELFKNEKYKVENGQTSIVPIPFYYKIYYVMGKWVLIVIIGFVFSLIAYTIDKIEILLVGFKHGYCKTNWFASQVSCCLPKSSPINNNNPSPPLHVMNVFKSGYIFKSNNIQDQCQDWISWSNLFEDHPIYNRFRFDFLIYVILTIILAHFACLITLTTKITSGTAITNNQENVATTTTTNNSGENSSKDEVHDKLSSPEFQITPKVMYTAYGSGVPEVKTILSGFVIRRFLGTYTLITKTITLILAIASGMALGKEGPYVHLATAVGNIATRFFPFIYNNELLKKQILSASASAGVALAFGSPLGGVLFILEEINHYLPSHQLFQVFFCAIMSTLFLKFLNPYGTGKTVLFELNYTSDWNAIELLFFISIGVSGGIFGALFVKFVGWWPTKFRQLKLIKNHPLFEVFCISLLTGLITFWNRYTKQASSELVLDLATPCDVELDSTLCPTTHPQYITELNSLLFAFIVKVVLTFVTFGLKLPCGIYVPSMVVGALYGRIFSLFIQYMNFKYNLSITDINTSTSGSIMKYICSADREDGRCVDSGIYSMISAGAFMAGVTRMNITLVTILFELTSSYTYVLPISIAIAVANWSAGLLEKHSLYEALLIKNDYPFMSAENEAIDPFMTAGDIITDMDSCKSTQLNIVEDLMHDDGSDLKLFIDITDAPYVPIGTLLSKLRLLADKSLLDGCLPLIKNKVCIGLIYFSELELCLDKLQEFITKYNIVDEIYCKLSSDVNYTKLNQRQIIINYEKHNANILKNLFTSLMEIDYFNYGSIERNDEIEELFEELINLIQFIDYSPIFINHDSELSLAHLIFDRIGNRVIVLLKNGHYYGVLHKKVLIDYCRREEKK